MRFKALKHKTELGMWGVFMDNGEVAMCSTPQLFPTTATKQGLIDQNSKYLSVFVDYDLITVELFFL